MKAKKHIPVQIDGPIPLWRTSLPGRGHVQATLAHAARILLTPEVVAVLLWVLSADGSLLLAPDASNAHA